jgi:hypothetical protein
MIDKVSLRSTIFRHLDRLVTAPVAYSLHKSWSFIILLYKKEGNLGQLISRFKANQSYLNIGLGFMYSLGFLHEKER